MSSALHGFFQGTEMPTTGWWETLWPNPAGVLTAVGMRPGMNVIDLCSGDGWFTLEIAKLAGRVTAIDIDPDLLKVAQHRLHEGGITNCDFIAGNAYDLVNLVPAQVDFVFMANAFHGVPDRPRLARSVRQVLKPKGQLAIVNWHPRPREATTILGEPRGPKTELRLSSQQTINEISESGLTFLRLIEIPPYHYGAVFEQAAI